MSVRPLCLADLPGLQAVQRQCYGADLVEGTDVFARRLALETLAEAEVQALTERYRAVLADLDEAVQQGGAA